MLAICLALINDDEDKKSFEQLVKKFEKKLEKNLENEKQALPLQPLSRGGHEGMTGATR